MTLDIRLVKYTISRHLSNDVVPYQHHQIGAMVPYSQELASNNPNAASDSARPVMPMMTTPRNATATKKNTMIATTREANYRYFGRRV